MTNHIHMTKELEYFLWTQEPTFIKRVVNQL